MKKLPDQLSELVTKGILTDIPVDLFSGQPIIYSLEEKKLWSVGPDGNNGPLDEESRLTLDLSQE